jgi:hypothetical protein
MFENIDISSKNDKEIIFVKNPIIKMIESKSKNKQKLSQCCISCGKTRFFLVDLS